MWIVNLALRRPYTFIVLAIFILIAGALSIVSTPKDIFPSINIPVVSVIFNFPGMSAKDLEQHLTSVYERLLTTTVDDIEHIESESLFGISVVKVYLQPNANVPRGVAQVTSISQAVLRQGNVADKDLGYFASEVQKLIDASKKNLPKGSFIYLKGQVSTMRSSFVGLYLGLGFSMLLVYLLMVVNFQSWTEPFIIITALPCALAGIVWMLFITGTTVSVPALMGAIMCMGVATANSVLVVTFANERLEQYHDSYRAALEAGYARIRPVLMTAVAMIIGMVPMALGLGEGGEQNAPLGRAVIGGLIFATGATLFFVPTVFMFIRRGKKFPVSESLLEDVSNSRIAKGNGQA